MYLYRWTALALSLLLVLSGCSPASGEPERERKKAKEERIRQMTPEDLLGESLNSMGKMKGYRWNSTHRQQLAFRNQPEKNTRVDMKQTVEMTRKPVRIHIDGTWSLHRKYLRETRPRRTYVTEKKEYRFDRNRWRERKRDGAGMTMNRETDPLWVLKKIRFAAEKTEVERKKNGLVITVRLEGKPAEPLLDPLSERWTPIPADAEARPVRPAAKVRLWVDKETFRLTKAEKAVEYTLDLENEQIKVRQEWIHRLKGEVDKVQVPEKVQQSAILSERDPSR
ncbi:hypothetical protein C8P63_10897 [Melghirimyces profundicolus]|uniref:Outer membrane lipoprotein-sorting protein n=1 Tax=Melghirimyces profundicolus TaxID=1242148 RepID=A0A2T6BXU0_9BACL|nr:DUF6612 family protein [Melghirimyces profundicolus]PTX60787.1 hypothetical protein C8P63_10897 [Melghirimyces profundicolus]